MDGRTRNKPPSVNADTSIFRAISSFKAFVSNRLDSSIVGSIIRIRDSIIIFVF